MSVLKACHVPSPLAAVAANPLHLHAPPDFPLSHWPLLSCQLSSQAELDLCTELGIAFLAWSPLGGIKSGCESRLQIRPVPAGGGCARREPAGRHPGVAPRRPQVIPIPGASRPESIRDSVRAADLSLTAEQLAVLAEAVNPEPLTA